MSYLLLRVFRSVVVADRFGVRNTYFAAIIIFTLASLGCGLSQSLNELIVFRIIQGIGGALLLPVGRLAMLKLIPRTQFLSAMSLMSLVGLVGPLIGPTLGGWSVEVTTWHWVFLINIPMGLLGLLITLKAMPNVKEKTVKSFDLSGFILLLVAMVGLSLGIEQLADKEYPQWVSLSLLGAALARHSSMLTMHICMRTRYFAAHSFITKFTPLVF